jgi:L-glyceraldehyde 3-phosphate reductase
MSTKPVPSNTLAGLNMPLLSLGSWHIYDRMDFGVAVAMVRQAVDAGINMFDVGVYGTPDTQPPPLTDVLFSAIVRGAGLKRDDYLLSEKLWLEGFDDEKGFKPQLENALFRVGAEYADVVVLGDIRRDDVVLRDLVLSLAELKKLGMIRAWGVNNWSATNIQSLLDIARTEGVDAPVMAQLKYSVARRAIPDGEPFAGLFAQGFKMQASDVMEGGVLVKPQQLREVGRDPGNIRDQIAASAAKVAEVAKRFDATPAQLCIAFTLTHPQTVNTLVGCSRLEQLDQAIGAIALLDRVGAEAVRAAVEPLWADKGRVDPEGP